MKTNSQNRRVLKLLKQRYRQGLSQQEAAIELNVWRLAARINDLRGQGHDIETRIEPDGHFARYFWRPMP